MQQSTEIAPEYPCPRDDRTASGKEFLLPSAPAQLKAPKSDKFHLLIPRQKTLTMDVYTQRTVSQR